MDNKSFAQKHEGLVFGTAGFLAVIIVVALLIAVITAAWVGVKSVGRSQKRADANNQVTLNEIQIKQTSQLVAVQQQKAQIKIEEAKGIAEAQRLINNTLTGLYLQHEAIQAQESQANKIIYVPSGNQGIPLVNNVAQ